MCFLDPVFLAELSRYLQKKQRTYGGQISEAVCIVNNSCVGWCFHDANESSVCNCVYQSCVNLIGF